MHSATIAEWIVARFTSQGRAASIIGDLLEAVPQKGLLWFWMSVARVVLSLTWRHPLAYLAALCCARIAVWAINTRMRNLNLFHHLNGWTWQLIYLSQAGAILSLGLGYTAIRFGLKDPFVRYIFAAWLLIAATFISSIVMPLVTVAFVTLGVCAFVYSAMSALRRKGLSALALAFTLSVGFVFLSRYLYLFLVRRDSLHMITPPNHVISDILLVGLLVLGQTFIFSRVHHQFFERNSRFDNNDSLGDTQVSPANS